jgi:hypothetical protein
MLALLAALALSSAPACPHPARDPGQIQKFRRAWTKEHAGLACPQTCQTYVKRGQKFVPYYRCGACQVDHICPVACCGKDDPSNMHWLDAKENRAKSDDCSACSKE